MKNHKICTKLQNYWPKGKNKEIFTLLRVLQQLKYYLKCFSSQKTSETFCRVYSVNEQTNSFQCVELHIEHSLNYI